MQVKLLCAALGSLSSLALAQERDTTIALTPVVVIADRVPVRADRLTSSVTILDARTLRDAGVMHLADALRRVPGVQMARSGSFGSPVSAFVRGGESDYVRVMIDGVPQNDPGGAMDLGTLTLDGVERLEFVRGPASVQYGSDAVSGVLNIVTRRAGGPSQLRLAAGTGSYGNTSLDLSGAARREHWSLAGSLGRQSSDGTHPFNSGYASDVASGSLTREGHTPTTITVRETRARVQFPTDGAGNVVDRNARRDDRRTSALVDVRHTTNQRMQWQGSLSWWQARGGLDDRPDGAGDTLGFTTYLSQGRVRRALAQGAMTWTPFAAHRVVVGGEWAGERQTLRDSSNYSVDWSSFAERRANTAVLAQGVGAFGALSYAVGARLDHNSTFGAFETGRAHVAWQVAERWRLRGAVGTAFKAPGFLEQFSTAFTVGNDALRPEHSRAREVGLIYRAGGAEFEATWFAQRFRDLIQHTYISPTSPSYYNVAAARSRGLELSAAGPMGSAVSWRAHGLLLRTAVENSGFDSGPGATFVEGSALLRRPARSGGAGLFARVSPRLRLDVQGTYVGRRDDRDFGAYPARPVELDAYTRVDIGVQAGLVGGARTPVVLTVRADNALGATYAEIAGFPAPGRVWHVGVRTEWMR